MMGNQEKGGVGGLKHYGCCSGDNRHMLHVDSGLFPSCSKEQQDCTDVGERATKRIGLGVLL